mmetsp:Transcript_35504/g.102027  ORF Transcript_35504/g.102027 Transcript_35504/m.102027 type:complete len:227 (+) Transcript_35504:2-682(+)
MKGTDLSPRSSAGLSRADGRVLVRITRFSSAGLAGAAGDHSVVLQKSTRADRGHHPPDTDWSRTGGGADTAGSRPKHRATDAETQEKGTALYVLEELRRTAQGQVLPSAGHRQQDEPRHPDRLDHPGGLHVPSSPRCPASVGIASVGGGHHQRTDQWWGGHQWRRGGFLDRKPSSIGSRKQADQGGHLRRQRGGCQHPDAAPGQPARADGAGTARGRRRLLPSARP